MLRSAWAKACQSAQSQGIDRACSVVAPPPHHHQNQPQCNRPGYFPQGHNDDLPDEIKVLWIGKYGTRPGGINQYPAATFSGQILFRWRQSPRPNPFILQGCSG